MIGFTWAQWRVGWGVYRGQGVRGWGRLKGKNVLNG